MPPSKQPCIYILINEILATSRFLVRVLVLQFLQLKVILTIGQRNECWWRNWSQRQLTLDNSRKHFCQNTTLTVNKWYFIKIDVSMLNCSSIGSVAACSYEYLPLGLLTKRKCHFGIRPRGQDCHTIGWKQLICRVMKLPTLYFIIYHLIWLENQTKLSFQYIFLLKPSLFWDKLNISSEIYENIFQITGGAGRHLIKIEVS